MTSPKYELITSDSVELSGGLVLHRIRALRAFANVAAGDLGGYIETMSNLSHEGNAWVADEAFVFRQATVCDDATVSGKAWVHGEARISGHARVFGEAEVFHSARVRDHAQVFERAKLWSWGSYPIDGYADTEPAPPDATEDGPEVYGHAQVCGHSFVTESAQVFDHAWVSGGCIGDQAQVFGSARVENMASVVQRAMVHGHAAVDDGASVSGEAEVFDHAKVWHDSVVYGKAKVCGHAKVSGGAWVYGDTGLDGDMRLDHTANGPSLYVTRLGYTIILVKDQMMISSDFHSLAEWRAFDDATILAMDVYDTGFLQFWHRNKEFLLGLRTQDYERDTDVEGPSDAELAPVPAPLAEPETRPPPTPQRADSQPVALSDPAKTTFFATWLSGFF